MRKTGIRGVMLLLTLIVIVALMLRLFPMQQYHTWDETAYLQHAERIYSGKANYDELAFRPPLLPVLIAAGFVLWHSPFIASIIVALLATSMCIAVFFIGRRLHSDAAGLFAALLVAVQPLLVQLSRLVLTDTLVAALLAFALLFALHERWYYGLLAGAFAALAGLMKFTGFGAAPLLLLFIAYRDWFVKPRFFRFERSVGFLVAFAAVIAPYVVWATIRFGSVLNVFSRAQAIVNAVNGDMFSYANLDVFTVPLLLGLLLLVASFTWMKKRERANMLLPYIILSVAWVAAIIGYLLTFPNKETRFATAAIVPLYALAGVGYAAFAKCWRYAAAISIALILILCALSFSRMLEPPINTWKPSAVDLSEHIVALGNASLPIYASSDYPVYGYYTYNQVVVVDGPNFRQAYPRIMPRDGYLIVRKNSLREPTPGWADSQRELHRVAENNESILYRYTKRER